MTKKTTKNSGGNKPSRKKPGRAARKGKRLGVEAMLAKVDPKAEREQARYDNPIASRELILQTLDEAGKPMTAKALSEALQLTASARFEALSKRLAAMIRDGQVILNRKGAYAPAKKLDLIRGTVLAKPDGFGFLRPDDGGEDLFIPPAQMRRVLHGDTVLVNITGMDRRGRREVAIAEILARGQERIVGRFTEEDGITMVIPDDRRIHRDILIAPNAREDARHGQIVVCEITKQPSNHHPPFGKIIAVLGDRLKPSMVVEMAIHSHELPIEWPEEALAQAADVPVDVTKADMKGRRNLRDTPLVTIDGADAKDFDDAVYCEPNAEGFRLIVAIADVSHYVQPGTALDDEAVERATSVYFPGFVVPMLPETLSNGICSLNPLVDRLAFVCDMQINRQGQVEDAEFYEAVIHSRARLTYDQVWQAIGEGDEDAIEQMADVLPHVQHLHQLYQIFAKARKKRGAIEFNSEEVDYQIGPAGEVIQAAPRQRNDAHRLIEECMITANVQAAKYLLEKEVPAPYRVHDRPPESKYETLGEFLAEFGLKLPSWERIKPRDYARILQQVGERPDGHLIEQVLLRSMALAVYQTDNLGHFGLSLDAYAHFTSPIRRYADLLVHRAIKHALKHTSNRGFAYSGSEMEKLSKHCSDCSRRADEAEREVDERLRCAFMESHVGESFDGTVSGVTSFGLFVELNESKIDGLVHVTQLPDDYYHFDPVRRTLDGERSGRSFRLGDAVRVLVLRASLEDRQIDFRLIDETQTTQKTKKRTARAGKAKPSRKGSKKRR